MKEGTWVLTLVALGLCACAPSGGSVDLAPPYVTDVSEPAPTEAVAAKSQAALMGEWRPAYEQAWLLDAICFQVWETNVDHKNGDIDLDRARVELQAEAQ
ncbi:MAG: hypothetical protein MUC88_29385, partial [Planctomycetes bacterium]|nr:hypothetical protein [Planctomycetota bacterium]